MRGRDSALLAHPCTRTHTHPLFLSLKIPLDVHTQPLSYLQVWFSPRSLSLSFSRSPPSVFLRVGVVVGFGACRSHRQHAWEWPRWNCEVDTHADARAPTLFSPQATMATTARAVDPRPRRRRHSYRSRVAGCVRRERDCTLALPIRFCNAAQSHHLGTPAPAKPYSSSGLATAAAANVAVM